MKNAEGKEAYYICNSLSFALQQQDALRKWWTRRNSRV